MTLSAPDDAHVQRQPVSRSPARRLRELVAGPSVVRLAGAHDALGARLVELAGFDAVWSSGLEISASHGVPDADILSMSELLDAASSMSRSVHIPVVADCDTGYGNSNNVIYMVQRYEAAGVAAMCIEDKTFPKRNSFVAGGQQLVPVGEFVGKLLAAKSAQRDPDTMIIARTEALIAEHGVDEALRRAHAYADAGADAILVHDKSSSPNGVLSFASRWRRSTPLVAVPTTYYGATAAALHDAGFQVVIYANHGLRASIAAMSSTFSRILQEGSTAAVEADIASLQTVFDLQGFPEFARNERRYSRGSSDIEAVILSAGDHTADATLAPVAADTPISMLDINGRSLLRRQANVLGSCGVDRVTVVTGHRGGEVQEDGVLSVANEAWQSSGELASLLRVTTSSSRVLVVYGDVLPEAESIAVLLEEAHGEEVLLLAAPNPPRRDERVDVLRLRATEGHRQVHEISKLPEPGTGEEEGEAHFVGIAVLSSRVIAHLRKQAEASPEEHRLASLLDGLRGVQEDGTRMSAVLRTAGWLEIRSLSDYRLACELTAG